MTQTKAPSLRHTWDPPQASATRACLKPHEACSMATGQTVVHKLTNLRNRVSYQQAKPENAVTQAATTTHNGPGFWEADAQPRDGDATLNTHSQDGDS